MISFISHKICAWLSRTLVCGALLLSGAVAHAEVPEAGGFYLSGTLMEYPGSGVTFVLPDNTIAIADEDVPQHELSVGVLPLVNEDNNLMVIQIGTGEYETLAQEMNGVITYKEVDLHPVGQATRLDGGLVYNSFSYVNEGEEGASFIVGLVADDGTMVLMVSLSPPEMFDAYQQAAIKITETVNVTLGNSYASSGASAAPSTARSVSSPSGYQSGALVGAWMSRSNRGSGGIYIESATKWAFSANGTVAWGSGAVVAGGTGGVSIRGGGDNPPDFGAWATNGSTLNINWQDGSQGVWTYEVFEDYNGTPTLALTTNAGDTYYYRKID